MKLLRKLWKDDSGQDLIEYALLIVLIALVMVASISTLSTKIQGAFTSAANAMVPQAPAN